MSLRIAFFVGSFPAVSETFVLRQITGLLDLGHQVDVYSAYPPESETPVHTEALRYDLPRRTFYLSSRMPAESGYWNMPVWPLTGKTWLPGAEKPVWNLVRLLRAVPVLTRCLCRTPRLALQTLTPRHYGEQAASLASLYNLSALSQTPKLYDLVHAHFGPVGNSIRFVRRLWKNPLIVTFHGYDFSVIPRAAGRGVYSELFQTADAITVNSEYARMRLLELDCPSDKIYRLHMGLNPEEFPYHPRTPLQDGPVRLLTVGRLVEKKGLEYSIRAVARVASCRPNIRYDIVGDGPLRATLQALVRALGLQNKIFLLGARGNAEVQSLMAQAHLFLLSSITGPDGDQEGTPVSLMEAQASGLPVVSTRHAGIPEVVREGHSGYLVEEKNVEALSERLLHLLEHPETWAALGRQGRQHVQEHFDVRKLNRNMVQLYQQVIARSAPKTTPPENAPAPHTDRTQQALP